MTTTVRARTSWLFVGGPNDGRRIPLEADQDFCEFPTTDPAPIDDLLTRTQPYRMERYLRTAVRAGAQEYTFYRHADLSVIESMALLFSRYKGTSSRNTF